MVKHFITFLICSFLFLYAGAQTLRQPVSAMYARLNGYSSVHADASAFTSNPAVLASIKRFSVSIYGERKFILNEMDQYRINASLPVQDGNLGLQVNRWGSVLFNETEFSLAYGRKMGRMDAGIRFNYYQLKAASYGKASAVNFDAGFLYHPTDRVSTGIHIYNPLMRNLNETGEKIPFIYSAGFGYDASDKIFIAAMITKTENQPVYIQTGVQYCFDEKLMARMGVSTGNTAFYFGAGIQWGQLRFDITTSLHQYLGLTPALMIVYNAPKK